jgi:hypothetical protein
LIAYEWPCDESRHRSATEWLDLHWNATNNSRSVYKPRRDGSVSALLFSSFLLFYLFILLIHISLRIDKKKVETTGSIDETNVDKPIVNAIVWSRTGFFETEHNVIWKRWEKGSRTEWCLHNETSTSLLMKREEHIDSQSYTSSDLRKVVIEFMPIKRFCWWWIVAT